MTRIDFIQFLKTFRGELNKKETTWENRSLDSFLEAMEGYTEDIQGYYDNMNLGVDADKATWENFKTILIGATMYE